MSRSVLITGGAGLLGSRVVRRLLAGGWHVVVIDDLSTGWLGNLPSSDPALRFVEGDVTTQESLDTALNAKRTEAVIHLAARYGHARARVASISVCETDVLGTLQVLEACARHDVERLIFTSTGCAVGGADELGRFREDRHASAFGSPHPICKAAAEQLVLEARDRLSLDTRVLRFFTLYGPGEIPGQFKNFIGNFAWWALHDEPIPLVGGGFGKRDLLYVDDAVSYLEQELLTDTQLAEPINVCSGRGTSPLEVVRALEAELQTPVRIENVAKRGWDQHEKIVGDTTKMSSRFSMRDLVPLAEGVRRTIQWQRERRSELAAIVDW